MLIKPGNRRKDWRNIRVGKLLPICATGRTEYPGQTGNGGMVWLCICDCGRLTTIRSTNLTQGLRRLQGEVTGSGTTSCGCTTTTRPIVFTIKVPAQSDPQ